MKLLLDTQIVQWLALEVGKLNRGERQVLASPRHSFVISAVSLWEMRIKWETAYRSGQRKGLADPEQVVDLIHTADFRYAPLSLTFDHCTAVLRNPLDNSDRIDRLLLAQAQVEGLRLLTRDHKFQGHPLALFA